MSEFVDKRLLQKLRVVRLNVEAKLAAGQAVNQAICSQLGDLDIAYDEMSLLRTLFTLWPKFSGDESFPVPSPDPERNPFGVYVDASFKGDYWTGEYGALRMELLEWLIHNLETSDV